MGVLLINTTGNSYEVNIIPDECPICHHKIEAIGVASSVGVVEKGEQAAEAFLNVMYECPRRDCRRSFIGTYTKPAQGRIGIRGPFTLSNVGPTVAKAPDIPAEVRSISPSYAHIVTQAIAAEATGLEQIAGVGYRKALEFLIKDYCIQKNIDNGDEIKRKFLGACIETYVTDANVKRCARLATWLGNDEAHYARQWDAKDLNDLKTLIKRNHLLGTVLTAGG